MSYQSRQEAGLTRSQVGHGGGQLQVRGVVGGDANLDGASPLVHHLVNAHLKDLAVAQGAVAQDHAVVEIIRGTAWTRAALSEPLNGGGRLGGSPPPAQAEPPTASASINAD